MLPALELVGAADGVEDGLARAEAEVVCVVQAEAAVCCFELLWGQAFEGCLGCDGHEDWEGDWAVGEGEE